MQDFNEWIDKGYNWNSPRTAILLADLWTPKIYFANLIWILLGWNESYFASISMPSFTIKGIAQISLPFVFESGGAWNIFTLN